MTSKKTAMKNMAPTTPDEQIFHLIFEKHAAIMLLIEPQTGIILDANQAAVDFYGYSKIKLCGMLISEINILPPEQVAAARQKALDGKQNYSIFPHRLASGEVRMVEVHSSPVAMQEKQVLFSIIHDITRRRQVEESLRESEERFHTMIDTSPDGAVLTDLNGNILMVNRKAAEMHGYENPEDMLAVNVLNLIVPEDRQRTIEFSNTLKDNDVNASMEYTILRRDGSTLSSEIHSSIIYDAQRQPQSVISNIRDITERKRTEESLQESERFAHATVDALAAHIAILDETGTILSVNRAWHEFAESNSLGLPASNAYAGVNYLSVCETSSGPNSAEAAAVAAGIRAVMSGEQKEFLLEYPCHSPDEKRWFNARVTRFPGEGALRIVVAHEDITGRMQAESALATSEAELRALVEQVPATVYTESEARETLYISPQVEKLTGYTSAEWLEDHDLWKKMIHPQDLAYVVAEDERSKITNEPFQTEYRILTRDGSTLWIRDEAVSIKNHEGTALFWQGVMYDITERKQAEEALQASETRFRGFLDSAPDAIIIANKEGRITLSNAQAEKLFGYTHEELLGEIIEVLIPEHFHNRHRIHRMGFLENPHAREMGVDLGLYGKRKDGSEFPVEISLSYHKVGNEVIVISSIRDITKRKQSEESIRQRVLELETLNRISLVLRSVSKQDEMLAIVLDAALAILNTSHGSIELHNKTTNNLDKTIMRGWTAQVAESPHAANEGITGKVFTSGETYLSHEFSSDPETRAASRSQIPPNWGGVCLPIRTTRQTLGVMIVSVPSERKLDKDEIRLLGTLSEMSGAALQRMQLHEQTVHRLEQIHALRAVDQAISSSRDMHLTLRILLTHTITQLGVDAADVLLLRPDSDLLELVAGLGFHTLFFESINLSNSLARRAIMEHRSITALDLEIINQHPQFEKLWKKEDFACYWCVPLIVKGEVKGALEVYRRTAFTPDAEWLEFLESLAGQAAIAIDSIQLFENLQRANLDLSLAYDATIEGWSRAMDLRDHETEGHTLRVTDLTLKLARSMQINESQLTSIRRGALLHDIGKMGVPDSILLKEGNLTDEEWVLMRKHPQLAHDMLAPIAYLNDALNIPYCHHEKWDGTGYPQGLKGEHIPLVARIFAVIDVWDALTNDRTYRKKWTEQKTRQYIQEQSGKHFDPQVVQAFLKII